MALNWSCENCEAYKYAMDNFDEDSVEWANFVNMRETLIWITLLTGYPAKSGWKITDDNWEAMYVRMNIIERVYGPYRYKPRKQGEGRKPLYITPDEVKSMIGLETNAGNKSETEFKTMVYKKHCELALNKLKDNSNTDEG